MSDLAVHFCLSLLALPGTARPDVASLVAPTAFHSFATGSAYAEVERLLGPAPHGTLAFAFSYSSSRGWCREVSGEGRWESTFGTVTVYHRQGRVTGKSFQPNAKGVEMLRTVRDGVVGASKVLAGLKGMRLNLQQLND